MTERKVILYIAQSLDGFIAAENDNLDFLNIVEKEGEDYGYGAFTQTIDVAILGRKTYDKVLTMVSEYPSEGKTVYIITRQVKPSIGNVHFYNGDIRELIQTLKSQPGKNIHCDGGAEVVKLLLQNQLIDEIIVSIIPIIIGKGTRLFLGDYPEQKFQLTDCKSFEKGLVQLHYVKV